MDVSSLTIKAFGNNLEFKDVVNINSVKNYEVNFGPWADKNAAIDTVDVTVKTGQVTISDETVASNVLSFNATYNQAEKVTIKIVAKTVGTLQFVLFLHVLVRDFDDDFLFDYV